jgi:hypothetical protein
MKPTCFVMYLVDETGFSNIWETTDDDSSGIWINRWETSKMLTDFLQVLQVLTLTLHYSGHPEATIHSSQNGPRKMP